MGTAISKESLISRQIDQNLKKAAKQPSRLLCLGHPIPPVSSTLSCELVQLPQPQQNLSKWLNLLATAFDTIEAIVFTVPLIWYEQCNKDKTNKLQQAMQYFGLIRRHFRNLSIIIILTERPAFSARIHEGDVDMLDHFPNYLGAPEDPAAALAFIRNEFKRLFYESRASDDWATLYILYDDGCKRLRSKFIAQAINAIRRTDSFAHINDMLTPCQPFHVSSGSTKASRGSEETRTLQMSSDLSSSQSSDRF